MVSYDSTKSTLGFREGTLLAFVAPIVTQYVLHTLSDTVLDWLW